MTPELSKAVAQVFKDHPETPSVIVCADGACFLPEARNLAIDHARRCGLKWHEVQRGETLLPEADPETLPKAADISIMTVAEINEWASGQTEVDELEAALAYAPSKGGVSALQNRIEQLKTQDR